MVLGIGFLIGTGVVGLGKADPFDGFADRVALITESIQSPEIPDRVIRLSDYAGHAPDREGCFDFAPAINRAIRELSEKGGGTLHFAHTEPPTAWVKLTEVYRIRGPIHLESNIELLLDHSVKLYFECMPEAYLVEGKGTLRRYEGTTMFGISPLIYAFNQRNIRIRANPGNGALPEITGDGERWIAWNEGVKAGMKKRGEAPYWEMIREVNNADIPLRERQFTDMKRHPFRPVMFEFFMCEQVEIDGLKVSDSPFWVVHPVFSQNMTFRNMIFDCQNVNNDGFDPDSSRNILIEHIIFNNHDDNLAIKAGRDKEGRDGVDVSGTLLEGVESSYIVDNRLGGLSENVVMRHCTLQGHYGVAVGSEMSGGVRHIYAYDCVAPIYVKSGLFVKSSRKRGGAVSHIYVKDFRLNRVLHDFIALIPNYDGDATAPYPPAFSDVYIRGIEVSQTRYPLRIFGWEDSLTRDVCIRDVTIHAAETPMAYNFVEGIRLSNVQIGDHVYNEILERVDPAYQPPKQN